MQNLKVIITHYHKDHIGDIGVIQYASYVNHNLGTINDKIQIYLPKNEFRFNKAAIIFNHESYSDYFNIENNYSFYIDDLKVSFEDNNSHTIESYMVKLQNQDFKIVYTSDIGTSKFEQLIEFCQNSDLIICESSFLKNII